MFKRILFSTVLILAYSCTNTSKSKVANRYVEFKNEFIYFSAIKDTIFHENVGCHEYAVLYTVRGQLWQDCNTFNIDSGKYFKSDFLRHDQKSRLENFMERANLRAINYTMDSVKFVFNGSPSEIIVYTNRMKDSVNRLDGNFYIK